MPTYNQLAASSLLNQQYNAALGLGTIIDLLDASDVSQRLYFSTVDRLGLVSHVCSWSISCMFVSVPTVPGLHGIPARRAPMVEQAVQTVPFAAAAQKKEKTSTPPQSRQPVRPTQRSGRGGSQVQKENVPTSKQT